MNQSKETWLPRCPTCSESNLVLAPANGFTKHIIDLIEVYCTHCSWRDKLADVIKQVYVRS
jgi:hypothetical protein